MTVMMIEYTWLNPIQSLVKSVRHYKNSVISIGNLEVILLSLICGLLTCN